MRTRLAALVAGAATIAITTTTVPAYADTFDPAPGWKPLTITTSYQPGVAVDGSGQVHLLNLGREPFRDDPEEPEFPGDIPVTRVGKNGNWTRKIEQSMQLNAPAVIGAGRGRYAIVATIKNGAKDYVTTRTYRDGAWGQTISIPAPEIDTLSLRMSTNAAGDAVIVWLQVGEAGRRTLHTLVVYRDGRRKRAAPVPADFFLGKPAITNSGRAIVVYSESSGNWRYHAMRRSLPNTGRTWSRAKQVLPDVHGQHSPQVVVDSLGRETVVLKNTFARQAKAGGPFSPRQWATGATQIGLAAAGERTRLAWVVENGRTYTLKTRQFGHSTGRTASVWRRTFPTVAERRSTVQVAVTPYGASYLAWQVQCASCGFGGPLQVTRLNDRNVRRATKAFTDTTRDLSDPFLYVAPNGPVVLSYYTDTQTLVNRFLQR